MEQEELDKELVGIGSQPVPDLDLPAPGTSIPGIFSYNLYDISRSDNLRRRRSLTAAQRVS